MSLTNAPLEVIDELLGRQRNQASLTTAKRAQGYVPRHRLSGGNDKAHYKGFRDQREHWGVELIARGWTDAIIGLDEKPRVHKHAPPTVFLNHGRWLVLCPAPDCGGSEVVDPDDPVFMCLSCGNIDNKGCLYPVVFPTEQFTGELEKLMAVRPRVNRSWHPHETLEDLRKENEENL